MLRNHSGLSERCGRKITEPARGIRSTRVEAEYQGRRRLADREEFGL